MCNSRGIHAVAVTWDEDRVKATVKIAYFMWRRIASAFCCHECFNWSWPDSFFTPSKWGWSHKTTVLVVLHGRRPCYKTGLSGNSHDKTVAPAWICAGPIKINVVTLRHDKRWQQCALWKNIIISEATPKIGNNSIKSKQLRIVNTDKTRSKHTRLHFPFQTLLTITFRIVTMPNWVCILSVAKGHINSCHHTSPWTTERSALSITQLLCVN